VRRPEVEVVLFHALQEPALWHAALAIRSEVFIREQGVPESEEVDSYDTTDETCVHALVRVEGAPGATGRLYQPAPSVGKIGRMAVLAQYRGCGAGSAVLDALINEGRRRGVGSLVLDAQTHAVPFYERRGFAPEGPPFFDCGIPHQAMRRAVA